tara:strand:+ start:180 stop:866 length:687 start_codon:yes stop_codon:yes gene_type:complete
MKLPKKPLKESFLKRKDKILPWDKTDEAGFNRILAREIDLKTATKKELGDMLVRVETVLRRQQRTIYNVCEESRWQRNYIRILIIDARKFAANQKKKNQDLVDTNEAWYDRDQEWRAVTATREQEYLKAKKMWEKNHKDILKKNTDCIKKNKEIIQLHAEVTRAYNGLHMFGKFAEEQGIDIKDHTKRLPENDTSDFQQSHKLLESGQVQHSYKFKVKPKIKKSKKDN